MKYTDAQIKAINQGRNPAIVSAGAGSGKTAVLTQRVVRLICDKTKYRSLENCRGNIHRKSLQTNSRQDLMHL
ncbi:MAG: UvrD-helicase domain-containing protein [[Eubacterium] siraeum]